MNSSFKELVIEKAFTYAKICLFPYNSLDYHESSGLFRSHLHDQLAELLDVDRDFVQQAFENCEKVYKNPEDIGKALDLFLDGLFKFASLPEKERHPVIQIDPDSLKNIDTIPNTHI